MTTTADNEATATELLLAFAEATNRFQMFNDIASLRTLEQLVIEIKDFAANHAVQFGT